MASLFDHAQVKQRYLSLPLNEIVQPSSLGERNQQYQEHVIGLGRRVAGECLQRAGMNPADVDILVTTSCTGYMIPSLDAYLIDELGFRPDIRRLPITELGCLAGAAALARARDMVLAIPGARALVIAVELSSLTFQRGDHSLSNLVSCALFGDGAAAALITAEDAPGAQILDTRSCFISGTLDAMGFDLRDTGFHMVLAKSVPDLLRRQLTEPLGLLLDRHGLSLEQIESFALHPGGKKILEHLEEELRIPRQKTQPSWDVLRNYGNLSSATILFVLHEWLTAHRPATASYGIAAGFGPGLSAELLLLRWL